MNVLQQQNHFVSIKEMFEEASIKYADELAIISKNKNLTYKELDKASNQLASYLDKKGIAVGAIIGCCLDNSLELIVAILGILKSGRVYVPLDPSYPKNRLKYMLQDANPSIILTNSKLLPLFNSLSFNTILLNQEQDKINSCSKLPPSILIQPKQLAYIIYTSGSTGKPKGIMVEHVAAAHAAAAHTKYYKCKLKGLLSSTISFDVSLLLIFHILTSGGSLYIPHKNELRDISKLINIITKKSVNYLLCVPSLYSLILNKGNRLEYLKIVSLTGEVIPNSIINLHPKYAPNAILYNEYGPSEYAIGTSIAKIYDPDTRCLSSPINAGKPLTDTNIYILNSNLEPLPSNTKGEICISGNGIARGYLNNSDLSNEKFTYFNGFKIYRTGDFGKILPDGNLDFLGRMDRQIKIKGYRIELGEVEHVIQKYPNIDQAIVILKQKSNKDKFLVTYFTSVNSYMINESELRNHLLKRLPAPACPSKFIYIDSFPLTPNGKIDLNSLSKITYDSPSRKKDKESQTDLEKQLIDIWETVLCLKSFDLNDHFFDLGGDSIGIVRVQTAIEKKLQIKLSVIELLEHPSISSLANFLSLKGKPPLTPPPQLSINNAYKRKKRLQRLKIHRSLDE
ncbi:MAG: Tyrocidine synthase 1 [Chlamydiae bacterium]|nr:Tyrocidine synthase 1 [Chlamydiota bacterium]